MKRVGGRWLVDSFIPRRSFPGPARRPGSAPSPTAATSSPSASRLHATWLLVPGAILSLALVILISYGVSSWLRGRRAVRAYEAGRTDTRQLPPLPAPTRTRIAVGRAGRRLARPRNRGWAEPRIAEILARHAR